MAYEANRSDDKELEKQRNDQNNANNVKNAANVAMASKVPHAVAAGAAVKAADKLTGGKASEAIGKMVTTANKVMPGGKKLQQGSNRLSESGLSNLAGRAAGIKAGENPNQVVLQNTNAVGGESENSLPSSLSEKNGQVVPERQNVPISGTLPQTETTEEKTKSKSSTPTSSEDSSTEDGDSKGSGKGFGMIEMNPVVKAAILLLAPGILFFFAVLVVIGSVLGLFTEYDDAFGMDYTDSGETNGYFTDYNTKEQKEYYERIDEVQKEFEEKGLMPDPLKVVAVFHVLNTHEANLNYEKITKARIREVIDSMFYENAYNEEKFKENLQNKIIPKYVKKTTKKTREDITNEIFEYIDTYYEIIGKEPDYACSESTTCSYNLKGFYIKGKGNVSQKVQTNQLSVRLMQCGRASNHNYGGTFGKPLGGESLVPFEKYILGVAYYAMGEDAPEEAVKAFMVVARSYALAKQADLRSWRSLREENDELILPVASCNVDQVYCDPDRGCSSNDSKYGQVHSGLDYVAGFQKKPLSSSSPLRTYAKEVMGQVLANDQNYVIYTKYNEEDKAKMISLAQSGLSYKQILVQVYNQGDRDYKATNLIKSSCNATTTSCGASSGEFTNWKQYVGPWVNVQMGNSGRTIGQIGCLVTSVSMLIAKSGVSTNIQNFNPGTFVTHLNSHGGFISGGNFVWAAAASAAPSFRYQGKIYLTGMSRDQKLQTIRNLVNQKGVYAVVEVKGNTGQHWVAVNTVQGDRILMMDPGSTAVDMWAQYYWGNTSQVAYYRVG